MAFGSTKDPQRVPASVREVEKLRARAGTVAWETHPTSFTRGSLGRSLRSSDCSSGVERLVGNLVQRLETSDTGKNSLSRMECSELKLCSVTAERQQAEQLRIQEMNNCFAGSHSVS